ncbi:hypothetical protein K505DRAFT_392701 [Melanomma pulvis-pyrius CBS 109.77]|uniref:Uncharacterized protein n=1 Tax=Melanomma pulvis-pyrius CBS 109.77 TaxID=1314802 RepID=A0A6A6WZX4_9PLEO|nr:hypothetical protein K505DRAFT_392701 [Melanomma pulvis-pyrius CBS 109.77]
MGKVAANESRRPTAYGGPPQSSDGAPYEPRPCNDREGGKARRLKRLRELHGRKIIVTGILNPCGVGRKQLGSLPGKTENREALVSVTLSFRTARIARLHLICQTTYTRRARALSALSLSTRSLGVSGLKSRPRLVHLVQRRTLPVSRNKAATNKATGSATKHSTTGQTASRRTRVTMKMIERRKTYFHAPTAQQLDVAPRPQARQMKAESLHFRSRPRSDTCSRRCGVEQPALRPSHHSTATKCHTTTGRDQALSIGPLSTVVPPARCAVPPPRTQQPGVAPRPEACQIEAKSLQESTLSNLLLSTVT